MSQCAFSLTQSKLTTYSTISSVNIIRNVIKNYQRTLRTRLAPRRNPCAETARLSVEDEYSVVSPNSNYAVHGMQQATKEPFPRASTQLTCFILQRFQPLSSFCNFGDVFPHDAYSVVNLGLNGCSLCISLAWSCRRS